MAPTQHDPRFAGVPLGVNRMTTDDEEIRIISPWPQLNALSDEECWERMSDADIQLLGMEREEYEKTFGGNPCNDPTRAR